MNSVTRKLCALRRFGILKRQFSDWPFSHGVPEKYKGLERLPMSTVFPFPDRSYPEAFARQQYKYNKLLLLSTVFLGVAISVCYSFGTFDYLAPPPKEVKRWHPYTEEEERELYDASEG